MCLYDMTVWCCRSWRWEGFRERCNQVTRIGETCGLKLIYETVFLDKVCSQCEKAAKKERRLEKMRQDLRRWCCHGGQDLMATIEKTRRDYQQVFNEWHEMRQVHEALANPNSNSIRAVRERGLELVMAPVSSMPNYTGGPYIEKIYHPQELNFFLRL
ncbi:hypothetical protein CFIMG_006231RA [Ceratocystis fimbriata CBS 114723]|uniref:Uncharacterized protein n=1 Tax=Ceratocystis fimbriata CBS 114723 TaxID=1035309 RepID=A0A2C5WVN5_9PEZI|nr:hypothetical protein CFIMG_006231RA [Ceratocystis fimbriata CBS 114723]